MNGERKIILFLDFDGTLSPIAKDPSDAILPPNVKLWLQNLSKKDNVRIGIVTGRALSDIKRKVGLKNIVYAANHGMEVFYNGKYLLRKGCAYKRPLQMLAKELIGSLSDISGVVVESKGLSVAVHYRKVNTKLRATVKKIVKKLATPCMKKYNLQLTTGKMVLEIRPAKLWNKGKAVLWMWKKLGRRYMPVYVGDDITDEDAFKALRPYGITIRTGRRKDSHAEYFVKSIKNIVGVMAMFH
ncbi:MAG: trehalose-phosphatase [Deltaproteobacteria bacterium RIFCSPLOWO2_02_FULL_46_8]|nr:MAG: trehalose-phosphatase [Deltaproteobacteria bacterium RIFCSPLOWO2_02_FULL_46_8]